MRYFEVKKNFDNFKIYKTANYDSSNKKIRFCDILIGNELYTAKQFDKLLATTNANLTMFNIVDYPKNESYYSFGARFNTKQNR